jgi:hypothetical protein
VLDDTPAAYWRLGEASGPTAASQTGVAAGAYLGGVTFGRQGMVAGDPDTAVLLNGTNATVRTSDAAALNSRTGLAIEAWVKPTTLPISSSTILRKDGQYLLRITSTGALIFRTWKGGASRESSTSGNVLQAGRWSHVVATWDGATVVIYVDGVAKATAAQSSPIDTTNNALYIGSVWGSYDWLDGALDEVAVYGHSLTSARVQAHFDSAGLVQPGPAPQVTLLSPTTGSTMQAVPNFGGAGGMASGDAKTVAVKIYAGPSASGSPIQTLTATVQTSGTYSVLASAPLSSGTYSAQAEQSGTGGSRGLSAVRTFTVDAGMAPSLLVAGDIAGCDTYGDEATAALLDGLPGVVGPQGDLAYQYGTPEEFVCYDATWGRQKSRSKPAVGGHEYLTPGAAGYFGYWGSTAGDPTKGYYSYDLGSWHIVVLNTAICEAGVNQCQQGTDQERWLRADLSAHPSTCSLAYTYNPRFSSGSIHGNDPGMRDLWQALYDNGVDVVTAADEHVYERFAPQTPTGSADPTNGIRQFTVGTGGRSHYNWGTIQPNSEVRDNTSFGILKLTLSSTSYSWKFIPEAGKSFTDNGTTACH